MLDQLLEKVGLKYEDLDTPGHSGEKEQLNLWLEALSNNQITVEKIKSYIVEMKSAVEMELTKSSLNPKEDMFLKARLKNYLLLEAFLFTPERAKEQLERNLKNIAVSRKG